MQHTVLFILLLCLNLKIVCSFFILSPNEYYKDKTLNKKNDVQISHSDVLLYAYFGKTLKNDELKICSGTFIAKKLILTTANCIINASRIGESNQASKENKTLEFFIHHSYSKDKTNDVGIVLLEKPIRNYPIEVMKLPAGEAAFFFTENQEYCSSMPQSSSYCPDKINNDETIFPFNKWYNCEIQQQQNNEIFNNKKELYYRDQNDMKAVVTGKFVNQSKCDEKKENQQTKGYLCFMLDNQKTNYMILSGTGVKCKRSTTNRTVLIGIVRDTSIVFANSSSAHVSYINIIPMDKENQRFINLITIEHYLIENMPPIEPEIISDNIINY